MFRYLAPILLLPIGLHAQSVFAPQINLTPYTDGPDHPQLFDADGDGDLDLLVESRDEKLVLYTYVEGAFAAGEIIAMGIRST